MSDNHYVLKTTDLEFDEVLPHIVTFYRKGLLAPFIGSGMSRPTCTSWTAMLSKLAEETGLPHASFGRDEIVPSTTLYRLADLIVSALRPLLQEERAAKYRNALRAWDSTEKATVPLQTLALARLFWPLVLTTNYDDLFWSATEGRARPDIVGRKLEDCHRLLRSLDDSSPPILWALQGFLGGQREDPAGIIRDARHRLGLANQIVLGHQQYQRTINAEAHFRRAFAEVFRRRSLLFLGSGLLEDYLVNLFGEIIHHHGPGPYPHFALLSKAERERFDPWFLQTRLGIVPVFYAGHGELPAYLDHLAAAVEARTRGSRPRAATAELNQFGFDLFRGQTGDEAPFRIEISNAPLPIPDPTDGECSVVSVGRWKNEPLEGGQVRDHLAVAREKGLISDSERIDWIPLDEAPSYIFRYGSTSVFAVAARRRDLSGREHDRRDLGIIPEAINILLTKIDALGFKTVYMGAIASGRRAPWHPIHPFAQVLRGIRRFAAQRKERNLDRVCLSIVNPAVWYPILANKIPVLELISSDLVTHRVEVSDSDGGLECFSVTLRESPLLGELLMFCRMDRKRWRVTILPPATDEDTWEPQDDTVIVPTMTVALIPRQVRGARTRGA